MTKNECNAENRLVVPVDEAEGDVCKLMWLSVIMQALSDALSTSDNYPFKQRRDDALEWFSAEEGSGSDFATVCTLAGVDFKMTKERIGMFITGELSAIDFRCFRKGNFDDQPTESRNGFFKRIREKEMRGKIRRPTPAISPGHFRKLAFVSKAANDDAVSHIGEAA